MDSGWDLPLLNVVVDLTFAIRMHGGNSIIVRHYNGWADISSISLRSSTGVLHGWLHGLMHVFAVCLYPSIKVRKVLNCTCGVYLALPPNLSPRTTCEPLC